MCVCVCVCVSVCICVCVCVSVYNAGGPWLYPEVFIYKIIYYIDNIYSKVGGGYGKFSPVSYVMTSPKDWCAACVGEIDINIHGC